MDPNNMNLSGTNFSIENTVKNNDTKNNNIIIRFCRKKYSCAILFLMCLFNVTLIIYQIINLNPSVFEKLNFCKQKTNESKF